MGRPVPHVGRGGEAAPRVRLHALRSRRGLPRWRIAAVQILPNLLPLAAAQFLVAAPAFLLAEANLGLLGLGVPEPLPSLGGMLRELENVSGIWPPIPGRSRPLPLFFSSSSACFHLLVSADEYHV